MTLGTFVMPLDLSQAEQQAALAAHIQATDPERWAHILQLREKQAAYRAEVEAREAAKVARFARLRAFLDTLPPLKAGRARKSLERTMRWDGSIIEARHAAIERLIDGGATLNGTRLGRGGGSFYDQEALTSYGLEYAAHLTAA